jgi:predicted MPP superfamily phosphohydrolase
VLGNHDHWEGARATRLALRRAGVPELRNGGEWLSRPGARLRIAGLGDLMEDRQDLALALGDTTPEDVALLMVHEPDAAESIHDDRVGLVLSGHTHGGQVVVPGYGAPVVFSRYGRKYAEGLVQGPTARVFITRGVGTISPPIRLFCRPEISLFTLVREDANVEAP